MQHRVERAKFDDLYAQVSAQLVDGRYRPGDRINLKELSTRLAVSVTPLREVLSRLVGRGVVTERRSEGYYLARLDARDIGDLYRLHLTLLTSALDAAPAIGPADPPDNIWSIFRAIVVRSGNTILADAQAYLDDRLMLLRRSDIALFGDGTDAMIALKRALGSRDWRAAMERCRVFHDERITAAADLAFHFGRGASR